MGSVVHHVLHGVGRKPAVNHGLPANGHDGLAGIGRGRAALKHTGVARAQAQGKGVGRHVGASLVDDGNDAQGDADLLDGQAVIELVPTQNVAQRVILRGDALERGRDAFDTLGAKREPVLQRRAHAVVARPCQVAFVGLNDGGGVLP